MRYILINTLFICVLLSEKLPNDVRWVVDSKEYEALCHQAYNEAKEAIEWLYLDNNYKIFQEHLYTHYQLFVDILC